MKHGQKQLYEVWWFWVSLVALVAISVSAGILSTGVSDPVEEEITYVSPRKSPAFEDEMDLVPQRQVDRAARSLEKVTKIFQASLIHRLDVRRRVMYVNEFNWKDLSIKQKENAARVVAEYLDSISNSPTGMLDVRSFRRGKRVALITRDGAFVVY